MGLKTIALAAGLVGAATVAQARSISISSFSASSYTTQLGFLTGDSADDNFLDSNDTFGIEWAVSLMNGDAFNRIILTLTDAGDEGATLRVIDSSQGVAQRRSTPPATPTSRSSSSLSAALSPT